MKKFIFFLALFFIILPIYGYFFRETHSNLSVTFTSSKSNLSSAKVLFLDEKGNELGSGILINEYIQVLHPTLGNCRASNNVMNFRSCFNRLTWFISSWVKDIDKIQVIHKNCITRPMDFEVSRMEDYGSEIFTWWVPLPHVGGKPYASYHSTFHLLSSHCTE